MNEKDKSPIEKRLTKTLKQTVSQPSGRVHANLLTELRQQKKARKNVLAYAIPLWQVAALLFLGLGFHYLFPNTIIQKETIVQTEIQPEFIYQTDTITQYKNIEKIVYRNVPVEVVKYIEIPIPSQKAVVVSILKTEIASNTVADTSPKEQKRALPTKSRTIRQDEKIMNFVVEQQPLNSFISPLSNK